MENDKNKKEIEINEVSFNEDEVLESLEKKKPNDLLKDSLNEETTNITQEEKTEESEKKEYIKPEIVEVAETPIVKKEEETFVLQEDISNKSKEEEVKDNVSDEDLILKLNISESINVPRLNVDEVDDKPSEFVIDDNKNKPVKKAKKSKDDDLKEEIENRIIASTGYTVYGGENGSPSSFSSDNPFTKRFKNNKVPAEKIKQIRSVEDLESLYMEQYNNSQSGANSPRITRFPLLLSGYYAEMTNYTYNDIAGVVRISRNPEMRFMRRLQEELVSLYNHISWTSVTKPGEKLSFDDWCEITMFPDINQFYFGAFDATYPGETTYNIFCGNCENDFNVTLSNKQLCYALQNYGKDSDLSDKLIKDILLNRVPASKLKETSVYIKAHELYEDKVIRPETIKVSYGVPTILDVLEYISVFEEVLTEFNDFGDLINEGTENHNILKLYTYIKKLTVPVVVGKNNDGKDIIDFYCIDTTVKDPKERMKARRNIINQLKNMPKDSFAQLFSGKEVAQKIHLKGIQHMIHNVKCPNCGRNVVRVSIDMSSNFFMEAAQTVDRVTNF